MFQTTECESEQLYFCISLYVYLAQAKAVFVVLLYCRCYSIDKASAIHFVCKTF